MRDGLRWSGSEEVRLRGCQRCQWGIVVCGLFYLLFRVAGLYSLARLHGLGDVKRMHCLRIVDQRLDRGP